LILLTLEILLIDKMQKTRFRELINASLIIIKPLISDSWTKRSVLFLALLSGFYFTNSLISFLLDKSINTVFIAIIFLLIMEIIIRLLLISNYSKLNIVILSINNFRIGSTYALILEAFKLGS
tara:strand:- start:389 stop:757 length:369 start_codon:yes stop_codon:yes gene_type:complete